MIIKKVSTKVIVFKTGAGVLVLERDHMSYNENAQFFKYSLPYLQAYIRQAEYIVMMTKDGCT